VKLIRVEGVRLYTVLKESKETGANFSSSSVDKKADNISSKHKL
jgi:hypothetical protein